MYATVRRRARNNISHMKRLHMANYEAAAGYRRTLDP